MTYEELVALVKKRMPTAEMIRPVGRWIDIYFPQYVIMADVKSGPADYVVGISAERRVFIVRKGTSNDMVPRW